MVPSRLCHVSRHTEEVAAVVAAAGWNKDVLFSVGSRSGLGAAVTCVPECRRPPETDTGACRLQECHMLLFVKDTHSGPLYLTPHSSLSYRSRLSCSPSRLSCVLVRAFGFVFSLLQQDT
jgi:hypothetical protein